MIGKISPLELRHFRLVEAISRTRNLTKAASLLYISQPAASQALKELEAILQTSLFIRTKKRMILTEAGKKMLEAGKTILEEVRGVEIAVAEMVNGEAGELRIGLHCILSWRWMPEVMKRLREAYPGVTLSVGNSHRFDSELRDGKWDIVITAIPIDHTALNYSPLFSDDLVLAMHPDHPLAIKKNMEPAYFEGVRLISLFPQDEDLFYNILLVPAGVKLDLFMTVEQPEAILSLITQDFGISILPKWSIRKEIKSGTVAIVPLSADGMRVAWHAVRLAAKSYPSYYDEFIRLSRQALEWVAKV